MKSTRRTVSKRIRNLAIPSAALVVIALVSAATPAPQELVCDPCGVTYHSWSSAPNFAGVAFVVTGEALDSGMCNPLNGVCNPTDPCSYSVTGTWYRLQAPHFQSMPVTAVAEAACASSATGTATHAAGTITAFVTCDDCAD
jgi:hypothetical protein